MLSLISRSKIFFNPEGTSLLDFSSIFCKKKCETEVQNIERDQVEVMLELEGQLLHEQVHVLVNLEPVQVIGVALGKNQFIVEFSFSKFH